MTLTKTGAMIVAMMKRVFQFLQIVLLVLICLSSTGCIEKEAPIPEAAPVPERGEKAFDWRPSEPRAAYEGRDKPTGQSIVVSTTTSLQGDYDFDGRISELDALAALRMSVHLVFQTSWREDNLHGDSRSDPPHLLK